MLKVGDVLKNIEAIDYSSEGLGVAKFEHYTLFISSLLKGEVGDVEILYFKGKDYEVLFVTGKGSYEEVMKGSYPENVKIIPFYEGLTSVMKKTDVMVSRAGASTLSEIIALEVPSILIPSPYVANNHQYLNALDLINKDAALMIEEKDLEDGILSKKVDELINDENKIQKIKNNLRSMQVKNSADIIYENLKKVVLNDEKGK